MNDKKHIRLLVLPELFPEFEGDWKGVFIEDYLKSVESIHPQTLYVRLVGKKKDITDEVFRNQFKVKRYNVTDKKVSSWQKPFLYIKWFIKGVELGKNYTDTTVIHAHGAILNGTLAYLIGKKLKVPFVVTEHTGPYSSILNSWFKSRISKLVLNRAAKVLVVSEHQRNEVLKLGIPEEKVEVSYNPVNTNIYKLVDTTHSKNMVFVSRLDEFKGGLRTLKAFHKIADEHPDYTLTIIGAGEEYHAITEYVKANNLTNKVILKGTLTKAQIAVVFGKSSFMVFPSRHETFGLVAAEALSCGLPVICTNQTAPKEFVNDKNGILVNPDSVDEIAKAMENMIENRSNYNGELIHNQIEKRFGLDSFGKYLTTIYSNLSGF
ncbi:MAG: glycosyltransferase [Bacteroidetes bacterium]|nr:glycosyltransferase [Bacteroidota bacterium]